MLENPIGQLHDALAAAIHRDLPDIKYFQRDWLAYRKLTKEEQTKIRNLDEGPGEFKTRRPEMYDGVEVVLFPQTWGSTAVGYGGIGGAAMTAVYTIIVSRHNVHCVYFGCGRLAYRIDYTKQSDAGKEKFRQDMNNQNMASVGESEKYR